MEEFHQIIKDYFNGRFEIDKPVYYDELTFLPLFSIKDNLDNFKYTIKPKNIDSEEYGYEFGSLMRKAQKANFLIYELNKILVEKRESIINYILNNDNNNSSSI